MCMKMMKHWKNKAEWLHCEEPAFYSEVWHGERFRQLSWFWDPDSEWLLPCRCSSCHAVIGQQTVLSAVHQCRDENIAVHVTCDHCYEDNEIQASYAKGDPRNIALIGHWDGWQPFKTAAHSCGR